MAITLGSTNGYVTSNLLLMYDASNASSYSGSGTVWADLSGNGYTGTLTNGPVYSSANRGCIVFDGVDDTVISNNTLSSISSEFTVSCLCNPAGTQVDLADIWGNHNGSYTGFALQRPSGSKDPGEYCVLFGNGSSWQGWETAKFTIPTNVWTYLTVTKNSTSVNIYINGSFVVSYSTSGNVTASTANFMVGLGYPGIARNWKGSLANIQVYSRALTLTEISKNFTYFSHGLVFSDGSVQGISTPDQGKLLGISTYSTAGSYTWSKPATCTKVLVTVTGGGGGGAGYAESGGSGGYSEKLIDVTSISSATVTIGGGGAGTGYYSASGAGGTSSFGGYCSASGGYGANNNNSHTGGHGGVGSSGDVNLQGGMGTGHGSVPNPSSPIGNGGGSFWGSGYMTSHSTTAAWGTSAPGAGGCGETTARTNAGRNGADGMVTIHAYT